MRTAIPGPVLLAAALLLGACDDIVVDDQRLDLDATGVVQGMVFVDRNGSGALDGTDVPLEDLEVELVPARGDGVVASSTTDAEGVFVLDPVPVGTYRVTVDPGTVPDTLEVLGLADDPFVLAANGTVTVNFRASFPTYPLGEVSGLPTGTRVFTSGIALNPRDRFGDAAVHLRLGDDYLRGIGVENVPITTGDSVRFLGRTALEEGLPVLENVQAFVLGVPVIIPSPVDRSTDVAAGADGGALNAALVRVRDADIIDTGAEDENFVVTIDDGSGPLDMVIRDFVGIDESAFEPGTSRVERAVGLLVAERDGEGDHVWRLLPRVPSDVDIEEVTP